MPTEADILDSLDKLKKASRREAPQDRVIEVEEDNTQQLLSAMRSLGEVEVLVGIPAEKDTRPDGGIGNAALGYIHETGSPAQNIPARPFLRPGIARSRDRWQPLLKTAGERALSFDENGMMNALNRAGIIASVEAQKVIQEGIPPPLKGPRYRKGREPQRPEDATPLWDTGNLLRSITYVVERKR